MSFLVLLLLDLSVSEDRSPYVTVSRGPLEMLITDRLRLGDEIAKVTVGDPRESLGLAD